MSSSPTPGSMPFPVLPGTRFGNYEIVERIGAGGMGEVYRAKDSRLGREVAIKTISLIGNFPSTNTARFEQEARSACMLNHPNIVTIYELGDVNGRQYIAMELVRGDTIRELLAAGPIPFRKTIDIAAQVADALAKAHEVGLVHRDLKPDNLIVSADGVVKILDFGLAKLFAAGRVEPSDVSTRVGPLTEPGTLLGTIGYMSPEQMTDGAVDFRSDQFSFGTVLYEMVTGRPAFAARSHGEKMAAILRDEPPRFDAKLNQVPAPFFWIVERCLAKDPKGRYASTRDLARDLATIRDHLAGAPVRQAECRCSNLPVSRTAIVGREHESAALRKLLSRENVRLVTLTGPGGIGKTRLALQVAADVADQFPDGVCFVALSAISDCALIPSAISQAMGLRETGSQPQDMLTEHMGALAGPMLLLLDSFEHLVSAGSMIAQLLTLSSKLKVVVTSQAPLHIYGEHEFPVPALGLPDAKSVPAADVLSGFPAVALFVERVRAVKPEFELRRDNADAVAGICNRLDGLPLAIELAAARMKLLSPSAMLARLESSLNLLTGGARDLPVRQQTLRGTVDWSYALLNASEQRLFRRLSVFARGCTLDGVEAVCDTKGDVGIDVLDGMASLVDKSLVQQIEQENEPRFHMLSTIREYAAERLFENASEATAARRAHAAYYLVLAEEGAEDVAANPAWLNRFEVEHANMGSALDYLVDADDADWGFRLGAALFRFWETREYLAEGRERITRLLKLNGGEAHLKLRSRLLFDVAVLAGEQGDYRSAQKWFQESLDDCIELHDDCGVAVALNALGINARDQGDISVACLLIEQCAEKWKDLGRSAEVARTLSNLANVVKLQGDYARATSLYDECLGIFQKLGDNCGVAWTLNYQGDLAKETGNFSAARAHYEKSLAKFRQLRDGWGIASALCDSASLRRDQGEYAEADKLYGESIKMFQDLGHQRGVAKVLESLAISAAVQRKAEQSLRLAGTAAALRHGLGAPLSPAEQLRLEEVLSGSRRVLGSAASLTTWMEGWAMPVEQTIREALSLDATANGRAIG